MDSRLDTILDKVEDYLPEETPGLYSLEAEMSLLGAVLIDPSVFPEIDIELSDFHDLRHKLIFRAINAILADGGEVTNITVADQLEKGKKLNEAGGPGYLAQLTLSTSFNTIGDERTIKDYSRARKQLAVFQEGARSVITSGNAVDPTWAITRLNELKDGTNNIEPADFSTWADLDKVIGPISWDWPNWLAKGFLNISVGMTGEGKSILALRICASYLMGWPWPDGTPFIGETGSVVWCEAEAAQALNLERAKKWGLPIERILNPLGDPLSDFRLNNVDHKDKLAYMVLRSDVVFSVVDSLSGADPTAEKSTEDAGNVNWLAALARDCQKPLQLTHHLRKRSLFDTEGVVTLDRVRGISTILQFSRLIWALDLPDKNNKDCKRLSVIKSNLGKKPKPLGVTIGEDGALTFGQAPQEPHTETVIDKAVDLLMSLLSDHPVPSVDLEVEMDQAGISWISAKRAKQKLGIVSVKKNDGKWYWSLPAREEYNDEYTDH